MALLALASLTISFLCLAYFYKLCLKTEHVYKSSFVAIAKQIIENKESKDEDVYIIGLLLDLLETDKGFQIAKHTVNKVWEGNKNKSVRDYTLGNYDADVLHAIPRFLVGALMSRPLRGLPVMIKLVLIISKPTNENVVRKVVRENINMDSCYKTA